MLRAALLAIVIDLAGCAHVPTPAPKGRVEVTLFVIVMVGYLAVHEVREHD